jgi:hypothetical protein
MNLIFGHGDLSYRKSPTLGGLIESKQFDLANASLSEPLIKTSISEKLDVTKEPAQSYLEFALDSYDKETPESYRTSIHNAALAINRRYDELLSDILDIGNDNFKGIKKFEFITDSLGIFIPTLIKEYVVDPRNDLEHEFKSSTKEEALKAYEIARLFIDYTSKYLDGGLIKEVQLGYEKDPVKLGNGFSIKFGQNTSKETKKRFLFVYREDGSDTGDFFLMDSTHDQYLNLLLELCSTKKLDMQVIKSILLKI